MSLFYSCGKKGRLLFSGVALVFSDIDNDAKGGERPRRPFSQGSVY